MCAVNQGGEDKYMSAFIEGNKVIPKKYSMFYLDMHFN